MAPKKIANDSTTSPTRVAFDAAKSTAASTAHALEVARAAVRAAEAAAGAHRNTPPEIEIAAVEAEADDLRARATLAAAGRDLDAELHARTLADGDEEALVIDLAHVLGDVEARVEEALELRRRAADLDASARARLLAAREAHARLAASRRAAGLPEPRRLPRASAPAALGVAALSGSHPVPLAAELAALRAAVEAPHEVDVDAAKIHALDVKARRLRAEHEVALRLVEEENARATEHAKRAKREAADDAKRAAAQHESMVAKFNAERAAEDALVAASRARSSSTGNPAAA